VPDIDHVYRKFGEVSEAAQLLETELGTMLFEASSLEAGLIESPNVARASSLLKFINRQTLGALVKTLNRSTDTLDHLESVLTRALTERNRLSHSFYRQHNFRRNSEEGRSLMIKDLESIHATLLDAYKSVLLLSGVDIDKVSIDPLPTDHLPL
jgi:hypothetical protein